MALRLRAVQVDGSAFRDEFEQVCDALATPLVVLPPRQPNWNGGVERANGAARYAFYPLYRVVLTPAAGKRERKAYQHYYDHYRPHGGMGLETLMSIINNSRRQPDLSYRY